MNDLFDNHAYQGIRHTSHAAAAGVLPKTGTQRRRVYDYILAQALRGATIDEIEEGMGVPVQAVGPRRRELEDAGLIIDGGKTRKTRNGQDAIAWVAVPIEDAVPLNRETKADKQAKRIAELEAEVESLKDQLHGYRYRDVVFPMQSGI